MIGHKLPELFLVIIQHDLAKSAICSRPIVSLADYISHQARRAELSRAAANFVKRQRGGSGNGQTA